MKTKPLLILFISIPMILLSVIFWPESKGKDDIKKYYTIPVRDLQMISYKGVQKIHDKNWMRVEFEIHREENLLNGNTLFRIEVKNVDSTDFTIREEIQNLKKIRPFYGLPLVQSIIGDWASLEYIYAFDFDEKRIAEYGLKDCANHLSVKFKNSTKSFCIGKNNFNDTRRYLLDEDQKQFLIIPDYIARRIENNIFAQKDTSPFPQGTDGVNFIDTSINSFLLSNFPVLKERTNGQLKLRMVVKAEPKGNIHVWHIENLLAIKPSHAAELAQYILSLSAKQPIQLNVETIKNQLSDAVNGLRYIRAEKAALHCAIKKKQTDKGDLLLTELMIFPPQVRLLASDFSPFNLPLQIQNLDHLFISKYASGYLSADHYPRLLAILHKIEGDLREDAQKSAEAKNAAEKKKKP